MKIQVSGHHMDVGDSFRGHIEDKITGVANKFFENPVSAHISVVKEKNHLIKTDIIINEGTGSSIVIKSEASDFDPYKSFDSALDRAETQLRKHKERIKRHLKNKSERVQFVEAKKYVMSPYDSEDPQHGAPAIIAENGTTIRNMNLEDAVMCLDLESASTIVFVNSATQRLNVIFYRNDGNIAWIDVPSDIKFNGK